MLLATGCTDHRERTMSRLGCRLYILKTQLLNHWQLAIPSSIPSLNVLQRNVAVETGEDEVWLSNDIVETALIRGDIF